MTFAQKLKGAFQPRFLPFFLVIPIILFQALSLSGCVSTSPVLPDLYIVSFSRNDTSPPIKLRLGYLGICAGNQTDLQCHPTAGSSADDVVASLFPGLLNHTTTVPATKGKNTPPAPSRSDAARALVSAALTLQSRIFVPLLAGAGFLFLAGLAALVVAKRRGTGPLRAATLACLCLSAALAFTACLATSGAAGALEFSTLLGVVGEAAPRTVVRPGVALQVLQWLAFGFTVVFVGGVPWMLKGGGGGGGGGGGQGDSEKYGY
ncbi:hypothetical protein QBC33DRAFT_30318 [Phialemonium atrogriseum]|uniref:Uncharacterized protein n=1 Tax=Phialemonium atrogriseum TaxID=1093897 RepID=A0AAJ0CC85_9PEZI|nr:uncharacterized protein QBC33DRAFT_30318 [Phialemonium atrogriseum]KAK1772803.1 hypothetical protein QBC33DRAFT_30318 [Phialemonium atrogriseum]